VEARAESFGENCLNQDGTVRYFATMQTDFRITVRMDALENAELEEAYEIASPVVLDVLRVLSNYPVGSTPGPMPGQITIEFPLRDDTYRVFFSDYNIAMDILQQSLTATATPD
jgi:hypothetical protein